MKVRLLILFLILSNYSHAQDANFNFGARHLGLAGSTITISDEYSLFNNIGGFGRLKHHVIFGGYQNRYGIPGFWDLIDNKIGVKFWVGMDWMPEGKKLWDFIKPYKPDLLTSPSRHDTSRLGKNLWVRNNLNPKPKVIFAYSADKQRYSKENAILIDDKKSNINEWAAKGGIAIRCKDGNVDHVIEKLQELGYE